jgi:cobalt-zinc-cadmium efflux system protein
MKPERTSSFSLSIDQRLALSMGITMIFVVVEIIAGIFANSLVLLTDATHNLTDLFALALTGWALWIANKAADSRKTFGYHRAGILVALVNSLTLALLVVWIFFEAWKRIHTPPEVETNVLIFVGASAVLVNLVTALLIRHGIDQDLNLRSAFLHLVGDVLSTFGAVVTGIIIHFTGLNWLDALISIMISFLILWNVWGVLRESVQILMESVPADVNMDTLSKDILSVEGVRGVHDLHVWSITHSLLSLSAHLVVDDVTVSIGTKIQKSVRSMVTNHYGISHATLQLESGECISLGSNCDLDTLRLPHRS